MRVQVIHEDPRTGRTEFGLFELASMPPVSEPFLVDGHTYYRTKGYLGPDKEGMYLLILEGEPRLAD